MCLSRSETWIICLLLSISSQPTYASASGSTVKPPAEFDANASSSSPISREHILNEIVLCVQKLIAMQESYESVKGSISDHAALPADLEKHLEAKLLETKQQLEEKAREMRLLCKAILGLVQTGRSKGIDVLEEGSVPVPVKVFLGTLLAGQFELFSNEVEQYHKKVLEILPLAEVARIRAKEAIASHMVGLAATFSGQYPQALQEVEKALDRDVALAQSFYKKAPDREKSEELERQLKRRGSLSAPMVSGAYAVHSELGLLGEGVRILALENGLTGGHPSLGSVQFFGESNRSEDPHQDAHGAYVLKLIQQVASRCELYVSPYNFWEFSGEQSKKFAELLPQLDLLNYSLASDGNDGTFREVSNMLDKLKKAGNKKFLIILSASNESYCLSEPLSANQLFLMKIFGSALERRAPSSSSSDPFVEATRETYGAAAAAAPMPAAAAAAAMPAAAGGSSSTADSDHILIVGSLDQQMSPAYYSDRPGNNPNIQNNFLWTLGTRAMSANVTAQGSPNYAYKQGTSYAAPVTTGLLALLVQYIRENADPSFLASLNFPAFLKQCVLESADRDFYVIKRSFVEGEGKIYDLIVHVSPLGQEGSVQFYQSIYDGKKVAVLINEPYRPEVWGKGILNIQKAIAYASKHLPKSRKGSVHDALPSAQRSPFATSKPLNRVDKSSLHLELPAEYQVPLTNPENLGGNFWDAVLKQARSFAGETDASIARKGLIMGEEEAQISGETTFGWIAHNRFQTLCQSFVRAINAAVMAINAAGPVTNLKEILLGHQNPISKRKDIILFRDILVMGIHCAERDFVRKLWDLCSSKERKALYSQRAPFGYGAGYITDSDNNYYLVQQILFSNDPILAPYLLQDFPADQLLPLVRGLTFPQLALCSGLPYATLESILGPIYQKNPKILEESSITNAPEINANPEALAALRQLQRSLPTISAAPAAGSASPSDATQNTVVEVDAQGVPIAPPLMPSPAPAAGSASPSDATQNTVVEVDAQGVPIAPPPPPAGSYQGKRVYLGEKNQ